jgi:hypothetical protein
MNLNEYPSIRNDVSPFYHLVGGYNCRIQEYEMSQNIIAPAAWMLGSSPYYWGAHEVYTKDLELVGLTDYKPWWFQCSAWCVKQKT